MARLEATPFGVVVRNVQDRAAKRVCRKQNPRDVTRQSKHPLPERCKERGGDRDAEISRCVITVAAGEVES